MSPSLESWWKSADTSARVKALLALSGESLEALAGRAGLTKQAWSHTLKRKKWTAEQVRRVASGFGITTDDLIPEPCEFKRFEAMNEWMNAPMGEPE